jgi:hypothetical protein
MEIGGKMHYLVNYVIKQFFFQKLIKPTKKTRLVILNDKPN